MKRKKHKPLFTDKESLEIAKNSRVKDDTDHRGKPFVNNGKLDADVTGATGKQIGTPYWDTKSEEWRRVIKLDGSGGVVSVPESRLVNKFGRNGSRKSYGFSTSYSRGWDRIFGKSKEGSAS
ncbi:MAG: hypothetical protein ABIH23_32565 [bacterium]